MADLNEIKDVLNIEEGDYKKLPSMLNVLTILTYVGCGLMLLSTIYNYFSICKSVEVLNNFDSDTLGSGLAGKMMDTAMQLAQKQCENRLVMLIVSIASLVLTFLGALQMRNLKKQGFIVYSIGEILLPIATIFILGSSAMGGMMLVSGLLFPIVFVILYFTQMKYLTN